MSNSDDSSTRSWDAAADDWVAHADTSDYQNLFLLPRMFRLLGVVSGRRVLDLGCGEGAYSRELVRRGARVTGIDGSARLIEVARQRAVAADLAVDYRCANASALDGIASESFDLIVASMSLMNVEDYAGAMREAHPVLPPGGELCMSITHPCFSAPVSDWVGGKGRRPQFFAVDRYSGALPATVASRPRSARPRSSATVPVRGLHRRGAAGRVRAARVSRTDGDGGRSERVGEIRAHDARAVLPVHALAEGVTGAGRPSYANVSWLSATPIVTVPPCSSAPKRIWSVSGSRTSFWTTRASGRAPNTGS